MQYLIGFIIALFIALTGVGAGTITVPVLVLFLEVPAPVAVGIGLMFSRPPSNSSWSPHRSSAAMSPGTRSATCCSAVRPACSVGSLFLKHLVTAGSQNLLNAICSGAILVTTASRQILFSFRPMKQNRTHATAAACCHG